MQVLLLGHMLTTFANLALLVADLLRRLLLGARHADLATAANSATFAARLLLSFHHAKLRVLMVRTALVSLLFH